MKKDTRSFFNKYSKKYDVEVINNYFTKNHKWIIERLPDVNNKKVLDIGCGPADLLSAIEHYYPLSNLYGVDISEEMVFKASRKVRGGEFKLGDSHELPYENDSFDFVINTISFHHYENPEKVISEMYRILKAGGILFLLDSITDPFMLSLLPKYWDLKERKYLYTKHLSSKKFKMLFADSSFTNVEYKKLYRILPVVHFLITAKK